MRRRLAAILVLICFAAQCAMAQASGVIQGKVTDVSGAAIPGAVVTVEGADGNRRTTVTDEDGAFQISSLPVANYNVTISASGLSEWTAANVAASVNPDSNELLAVLQVAPKITSVTVGLPPEEVASYQLDQELKQRALGGALPNYYVTYERHPAPLSPSQKLHFGLKTLLDPATFAAAGITAGIQQERNSYRQFGQGAEGYAKRFGAAYGIAANGLMITSFVANSVFHQDPRYFYSGEGTRAQRAWYAVKSAFLTRGDNGKWQPPYSTVTGMIASAEISQLYLPGSRTQLTVLGRSFMFRFGGLVGLNLAEEFLLKKVTNNKPRQLAGDGPVLREGTPVALIAVDGFSPKGESMGQTVRFVLAQDLSVDGKVLAKAGDTASGQVGEVSAGTTAKNVSSVALEQVNLQAGKVNVPLRSSQPRGVAAPAQYKELPDCGKFEVTLFVAQNVKFDNLQ
ncbi:MAG: carboxypeptidase regulatory-like domain-containing protein [Acidobacteriaceae bacterium]|nr:carboxypeptidase regulatory-like domain-containing protein [Acidobacteriaceae bacterium]